MMSTSLRQITIGLAAVGLWLSAAPAHAQSSPSYAAYYGDGLRHYTEGRLSEAVEHLYRAYALRDEPATLSLIIRAYDEMGHCDAVERQLEIFALAHPEQKAPQARRCATTGQIELRCKGGQRPVRVDEHFEVACGKTVSVPVGERRLVGDFAQAPRQVSVSADQTVSVELVFSPAPKRWKQARGRASVDMVQDSQLARVDRLDGSANAYTVYQSPDGLYHIFIHQGGAGMGGVIPIQIRPEVLRLCDTGERYDQPSHSCVPVEEMQIQKME